MITKIRAMRQEHIKKSRQNPTKVFVNKMHIDVLNKQREESLEKQHRDRSDESMFPHLLPTPKKYPPIEFGDCIYGMIIVQHHEKEIQVS